MRFLSALIIGTVASVTVLCVFDGSAAEGYITFLLGAIYGRLVVE